MAAGVKVIDKDRGFKKLTEAARASSSAPNVIKVGIQGNEASAGHGEFTNSEIGSFHEFGLGVPERSFIRGWFDENRERIGREMAQMGKAVAAGRLGREQAMGQLGARYVGEIQKRMAAGIEGAGGEDKRRLINTGQLRSSITWLLEHVT